MKRFAPTILATLVGTLSLLAFSQNADASPYEWHEWHNRYYHDHDHWRDRAERREREEWRERHERRREWWREHHG